MDNMWVLDARIEMDNRDLNSTDLNVHIGDNMFTYSVDPFEMVQEAIDNLPEDISVSVRVLWDKFVKDIEKYTDVPYDEDPSGTGE